MSNSQKVIRAVTFFGGSEIEEGAPEFGAAKKTAQLVAKSGRHVINGGGPGIMLAATLGAKEGSGKVTVVNYNPKYATRVEGASSRNIADIEYEEQDYVSRIKRLLELGDIYVFFNGGTGTISEFGLAWSLARLYLGHQKPLILYGQRWQLVIDCLKKNLEIREEELNLFSIVSSPEEIIKVINQYEELAEQAGHEHPRQPHSEEYRLL